MKVKIDKREDVIGFVTETAVKGNFVYGPRDAAGKLAAVTHAEAEKMPHDSIVAVSARMVKELQDPANYLEEV